MAHNYLSEEYYSIQDAYDPKIVVYKRNTEGWPRHDYYRGNPLSSQNFINPNLAGYRKIPQKTVKQDPAEETEPKIVWVNEYYYPGGMIWPHNEPWKKTKEIILYR